MAEAFVLEITKLYEEREQEREASSLQASLSPQRGPRLSNLSFERFRISAKTPGPPDRRGHRVLCRRLLQWHDRGPIEHALEDDCLSRDPSPSKRDATSGEQSRRLEDGPSDSIGASVLLLFFPVAM